MPECATCGSHVSRQFARVFADQHGDVLACVECAPNAGISQVAMDRTAVE